MIYTASTSRRTQLPRARVQTWPSGLCRPTVFCNQPSLSTLLRISCNARIAAGVCVTSPAGDRRITEGCCHQGRSQRRTAHWQTSQAGQCSSATCHSLAKNGISSDTVTTQRKITTPHTWNFRMPSNVSRTQQTRSFCCHFIDSAMDNR